MKTLSKLKHWDTLGYKRITSFRNYTCKPQWPAGKTINFDKNTFIWECRFCENNSVKNKIGNDECAQCDRGWKAN